MARRELTRNIKREMNKDIDLIEDKIIGAEERLKELAEGVKEGAIEKRDAIEDTIQEHPFMAVGAAAAAGLLIGLLIGKRRRD